MTNDDNTIPEAARAYILAATILASSMAFIDGTVVNIALPAIQIDLAASLEGMQWVLNAYTLCLGALILVGGAAGDRLGRRRLFIGGILVFAVASMLCGTAPGSAALISARALQGIGGAMLLPGSLAILVQAFPKEVRGRAIGTWAAFAALMAAGGPVLGGVLVETLGWRTIFFLNLPIAAAALWLTLKYVPENCSITGGGTIDWPGALVAILGLLALTYGLSASAQAGFGDLKVAGALFAGVALLMAFLWIEQRSAAPMMPLSLFRSRNFAGANLITIFLYFALSGVFFLLPFNLIQVQNYSPTAAGAAFLPFSIIIGVFSGWSGGVVDRFGAKPPLVSGPLMTGIGCALLAIPGVGGSYWTGFLPAMLMMGVGMTISIAPLTTAAMNAADDHQAGIASGVNNAASRIAGLLAVATLGMVAISAYGAALQTRLAELALDPSLVAALLAAKGNMLATEIPETLAPAMAASVTATIKASFVTSFRIVVLIAAAMALLASLCAWKMIESKRASR